MRYVEFIQADPFFYDRLRTDRTHPATTDYRIAQNVDWAGWEQNTRDGWHGVFPRDLELPEQGWKVHVSATLENAQCVLDLVSGHCGRQRVPFKYRATRTDLLRINLKYADRGTSGKFVTVYPATEQACAEVLNDLDALVGGMDGPYVLSDLRWNQGPVYLRYGGFRALDVRDEHDQLVPAIRRPDGELVPDRRTPSFAPPAWVPLPAFVTTARERLNADDSEAFGYRVREALHFSNGGGVYLAERLRDAATVVLKEARPHAGLSPDGRDAVERLQCEREQLERLRGVPSIVGVLGGFEHSGHHFLVLEHVGGRSLNREIAARHPMVRAGASTHDRDEYRAWALGVLEQIEAGIRAVHEHGQVHGDLHPGNVLVTPDGTVRFVDLELSYAQDAPAPSAGGAPGFTPPDGRTGVAADLYSLACLKIALFIPLTPLLALDHRTARRLIDEAVRRFGLDIGFGAEVLARLEAPRTGGAPAGERTQQAEELARTWPVDTADGVQQLRTAIVRGLHESLDLSRADRVFPGDVRQFTHDALSIAHGACGVLPALHEPGESSHRADAVLDWVSAALHRAPRTQPGLLDGITGIARTFSRFGRVDEAARLTAEIERLPFEQLPGDLYGGLVGIGLDRLDEDPDGAAITEIRRVLRDRTGELGRHIRSVKGVTRAARDRGGLLRGATGAALFWLRCYETYHQAEDLDRARRALAVDLSACTERPDGSLQLDEDRRSLPYLGSGSIGVALVAMRLLEHLDDEDLRRAVRRVIRVTRAGYTAQSGLLNGRAGFVLFLTAVQRSPFADAVSRADLIRHTRDLGLYALVHGTGLHFPGEQILRASTDWASGSAGVLTALDAYAHVVHGTAPAPTPPIPGLFPGTGTVRPPEGALDLRSHQPEPTPST
ncbi:class III lanthionine synthetase LanKC [Kineosporia succinea]|nr:class III lanthionine synthetase LanKC [Kineosporia succinea]